MRNVAIPALLLGAAMGHGSLFDVTSVTTGNNGSASGTSNGIGFTLTSDFIWSVRTTTDGTYQGFTGSNFSVPMPNADRLHGSQVSITFAQNIQSALIYITDDESGGELVFDFGVVPEVLSGSIQTSGTRFGAATAGGGLVRLSGLNTNTLFSPEASDGNDYAIVADPVPEPATCLAIAAGLAAFARRRRTV